MNQVSGRTDPAILRQRMVPIPKFSPTDTITSDRTGQPCYRIIKLIGAGGVGRVYAAEIIETGEQVVLKIPKDWDFTYDVFQEARYLLGVPAVHVAKVRDVDAGTGRNCDLEIPYLVMDSYVTSLAAHLQLVRSVDRMTALKWTRQIALGLHSSKLLHRDVKPENILFDADQNAWISDFGLALPSNPYVREKANIIIVGLMGTAAYMSPEQIGQGETIDHRSDIYALGLLLFEMVHGEPAHPRKLPNESPDEYFDRLLDYRVDWQQIKDPVVGSIVRTCTENVRSQRYPDYWTLLADLEEAMKV